MEEFTSKQLLNSSILSVVTGSTMYGLNIEGSDRDLKNIVKVPENQFYRLGPEWETSVFHEPDEEFHSVKKALTLLNKQNPTVLEMLFAEKEFYTKMTEEGKLLIENRELFLTQNCYFSFGGYAKDQLMRIKNGLGRADDEDLLEHLDYKIREMIAQLSQKYGRIAPGEIELVEVVRNGEKELDVILSMVEKEFGLREMNGIFSELNATLKNFNKVNSRNRKVETKLDKHAMHLIRLLKMGIEVLNEGKFSVKRTKDRDELMAIRRGEMEWEELFLYADNLFKELEIAYRNTSLPKESDKKEIEHLYYKIQKNNGGN